MNGAKTAGEEWTEATGEEETDRGDQRFQRSNCHTTYILIHRDRRSILQQLQPGEQRIEGVVLDLHVPGLQAAMVAETQSAPILEQHPPGVDPDDKQHIRVNHKECNRLQH